MGMTDSEKRVVEAAKALVARERIARGTVRGSTFKLLSGETDDQAIEASRYIRQELEDAVDALKGGQ